MSASLAGAAAQSGTILTFLNYMTMTKLKLAVLGGLAVASAGGLWFVQHQRFLGWRAENQSLKQQVAQSTEQQQSRAHTMAQEKSFGTLGEDQRNELLRLRGEVGMLRRQLRELERTAVAASAQPSAPAARPIAEVTTPPPPPFQLQLVLDEPGENAEALTNQTANSSGETLYVQKTPLLDATAVRTATVITNATGAPQIEIQLNPEGQELFAKITKENVNKRLAIVLNGRLYSAPVIRSEITGGKAQISGAFTEEEAQELAARINEMIGSK
jgi:preprotein translocase subunit SecD